MLLYSNLLIGTILSMLSLLNWLNLLSLPEGVPL
jgi:hypothetical protein